MPYLVKHSSYHIAQSIAYLHHRYMNTNPIIIIDDDNEDLEFAQQAFAELNVANEVLVFDSGEVFLDFMKTTSTKAFFILCDINMSKINGLDLKKIIFDDERLRIKCVPFIFLSTSRASDSIMRAYSFGVQGYFIKPSNMTELKEMFQHIINYWKFSQRPLEQ